MRTKIKKFKIFLIPFCISTYAKNSVYNFVDCRIKSAGPSNYKGTKSLGSESYEPPELQKGTTYYWRIDEYNTDAMISKGRNWRFTTVREQGQTLSSQIGSSELQQVTEEQSETLIQKDLKEQ